VIFHFICQAPWSREGFIKLLETVQQVIQSRSNNAQNTRVKPPIVVHCVDGSSQSGLFCAVWNICEKMKLEREVDLFHTIKAIKLKRFHCINSLVNILFTHNFQDDIIALVDYAVLSKVLSFKMISLPW